jgi:hypothetical protein
MFLFAIGERSIRGRYLNHPPVPANSGSHPPNAGFIFDLQRQSPNVDQGYPQWRLENPLLFLVITSRDRSPRIDWALSRHLNVFLDVSSKDVGDLVHYKRSVT